MWKIVILALLLAGLVLAVYLVQTKKIFKSKAYEDSGGVPVQVNVYEAFDLTDSNGNPLACTIDTNQRYTCYSKTRNVKINLNKEKLGKILQ